MEFIIIFIFLIPMEWSITSEMVSRQLSSYSASHKDSNNINNNNGVQEKSKNNIRRQFSVCAVGCPGMCSPRCEPSCCTGGGGIELQPPLIQLPSPPPPLIQLPFLSPPIPNKRVAVKYVAAPPPSSYPSASLPAGVKYGTRLVAAPPPAPSYKVLKVPQPQSLPPPPPLQLQSLTQPNLACGPTCNPKCISTGCSSSCCNSPMYPASEPIAAPAHQMSPGQIASAGCSPVCANHWVATFTGTIYSLSQSPPPPQPCPSKCASSCCNPPPAYMNLMRSCAADCAPTYYPECCLGTSTIPYQPPDPFEIQRTAYSPCSTMCAPTYTPSCCTQAAMLPPLKRK